MTSDPSSTNTRLLRTRDARDPAELQKISAARAALVQDLIRRDHIGHRALDRSDLAGEVTTRLVPPPAVKPEKVGTLGRLLTALRKWWS